MVIHSSFQDTHTCLYHKFLKCKLFYQQSDLNSAGRAEECNWFEFDRLNFKLTYHGNPPLGLKSQTQYAPKRINIRIIKVMSMATMMLGSLVRIRAVRFQVVIPC